MYTHTLYVPRDCVVGYLCQGAACTSVAMRTESCTRKQFLRSRVALNAILAPGIRAFVARSLSVKLNSRRNSTRYTRDIPPPRACSPLVSLYTRPAKKRDANGGCAPPPVGDEPPSFRRLPPPPLVSPPASIPLRAPLCSALTDGGTY